MSQDLKRKRLLVNLIKKLIDDKPWLLKPQLRSAEKWPEPGLATLAGAFNRNTLNFSYVNFLVKLAPNKKCTTKFGTLGCEVTCAIC